MTMRITPLAPLTVLLAGSALAQSSPAPQPGATSQYTHAGPPDRIDILFSEARIVHPGHGANGPKATLLPEKRAYIVETRQHAMTAYLSLGSEAERKARAVAAIKWRYPYEYPAGPRAILPTSVDGLFTEFAKPQYQPVR